jgi:hypothetical protein
MEHSNAGTTCNRVILYAQTMRRVQTKSPCIRYTRWVYTRYTTQWQTCQSLCPSRQSESDRRTSRDKGSSRYTDRCYCCHWRQKETQQAVPACPGCHRSRACCPSPCEHHSLGGTQDITFNKGTSLRDVLYRRTKPTQTDYRKTGMSFLCCPASSVEKLSQTLWEMERTVSRAQFVKIWVKFRFPTWERLQFIGQHQKALRFGLKT